MSKKTNLISHIKSWKKKGIISQKQQNLIFEDLKTESPTSNLFKYIAIIGSLFVGLGIILLISSNWEYLPKLIKLILILSMPVIAISLGYYLSYIKKEYQKIGDAFIFLGALLIGASLSMFGQLYNLDGSVASLLTWWFLLTIPLTFLFKFRILAVLTISLFYLALFNFVIDTFRLFNQGSSVVLFFTLTSLVVLFFSFTLRKTLNKTISKLFEIFEIVSLKVLLFSLFLGTIDNEFFFLGNSLLSEIFQNILFLGTIFFIMWFSNKNYNTYVRNSTFFWLGAYMIAKYFTWLWDYMQIGLFFVLFGLFLLLLVFGYIKGVKYLEGIKKR